MHINVTLTESIINECLALHYKENPVGRRQKQRLVLIPLILVCISAYLIVMELQHVEKTQNFYMALLYISFAFIYYFFMKNRMVQSGGKLLKTLGENSSFEMEVENNRLTTITQSTSFDSDWTSFTSALISKENVLLYQPNNSFSMFHHTFFRGSDFAAFKALVKEKISQVTEV